MERSDYNAEEQSFFNMPPAKLDLSQAHSLRIIGDETGRAETTGNPHIQQFRKVLEEVMTGLTEATQKTIEGQTLYFDTTIKEFMASVQEALNDIDARLNLLSQSQAQTEYALDAFIKVWMFGNTEAVDLAEQQQIVFDFLRRGLPQETAANTAVAA